MRVKVVIALLILLVVVAGCSQGTAPAEKEQQTSQTQVVPTGSVAIGKLPVPRTLKVDKKTPLFLKQALERKEPIVILFYTQRDYVSSKVREELQNVLNDPTFSGKVIFLLLDTEEYEKTSRAAEMFKVNLLPHLAIIDDKGTVVAEYRGYVDSEVIKQALYNVLYQ